MRDKVKFSEYTAQSRMGAARLCNLRQRPYLLATGKSRSLWKTTIIDDVRYRLTIDNEVKE